PARRQPGAPAGARGPPPRAVRARAARGRGAALRAVHGRVRPPRPVEDPARAPRPSGPPRARAPGPRGVRVTGPLTAAPGALVGDGLGLAGAVALAGLARPAPDLPGELRELAQRAEALRLDEGARRLRALAAALERVSAAEPEARRPRAR